MLENNINTNSCTSTTTDCCFVECTTTTTIPCINPIDQLFEIATQVSEVNGITKLEGLVEVLDNGFVLNSCGTCCPDCRYIFASKETYEIFIEAIFGISPPLEANLSSDSDTVCCINLYGSYFATLSSPASDFYKTNCCNNFTECADSIFDYFVQNNCEVESDLGIFSLLNLYTALLDIGIVEQGSINSETQVCRIFENMKDYFGLQCFVEEFITILGKGIVIDCTGGRMFISSVETFLKYIES